MVSLNVHGMVSAVIRRQVNEVLWNCKSDVYCLQENMFDAFSVGILQLVHPAMECFPPSIDSRWFCCDGEKGVVGTWKDMQNLFKLRGRAESG